MFAYFHQIFTWFSYAFFCETFTSAGTSESKVILLHIRPNFIVRYFI